MKRLRTHPLISWLEIALLASVCAAGVLLPSRSFAASPVQAPSPAAEALGVYAGPGNVQGVRTFGAEVGNNVHYAMDFINGSSWRTISDPIQQSVWQSQGYSMIWGVPMLPTSGGSLTKGATGAYDTYFATLAQRLVAGGQGNSIIRMGWEFNGFWFPWGGNGHAGQFVQYWRHIVTTMRSTPGAHFKFEWNPTRGDQGVGDLASYYPGNAYVDYVGLDVFDVEWQSYPGARAEFASIKTEPYGLDWLAAFSAKHHKPMVFPEWGLGWGTCARGAPVTGSAAVCGGDNPTFINDMTHWFATHNVFEATYWDYGSSSVSTVHNHKAVVALKKDAPPVQQVAATSAPPTSG